MSADKVESPFETRPMGIKYIPNFLIILGL